MASADDITQQTLTIRPRITGADLARRQRGGGLTLKGGCEWGLGGWVDG